MLLNKADRLDPDNLQQLMEIVTSLNPLATVRALIGLLAMHFRTRILDISLDGSHPGVAILNLSVFLVNC